MSNLGNGILEGLSAVHQASIETEIKDLDAQLEALTRQITDLQEKKTKLKDQLTK
jgi:peptidoglycan hydrolase CwlO-like protein